MGLRGVGPGMPREGAAGRRTPPPLHGVHVPVPGTGGVLGYVVKGIKASLGIEVADKPPWRQEEFLDCLSGPSAILPGGGGRQES